MPCPVLVLQGVDDEYGTTRADRTRSSARRQGPVTAMLIQKCGHSPHRDQPFVVLDHLAAFMARLHG